VPVSTPVFVEVEPLPGCVCEDCARQRLVESVGRTRGGYRLRPPVAARVLVAAAGGAVVAAPLQAAAEAPAPAAHPSPRPLALTRGQILERARAWVEAGVPYSMNKYWRDGYRQDCSGFVSMAWGLGSNQWTGSLPEFAERIDPDDLMPGDILLHHDPARPHRGSHVVIFGGWADSSHRHYLAYEQTRPRTVVRTIPYPYLSSSSRYIPYRYRYIQDASDRGPDEAGEYGEDDYPGAASFGPDGDGFPGSASPGPEEDGFPGAAAFGPGAFNDFVTQLGGMLVLRGGRSYYRTGPGPQWSDADRRAVKAFQRAQGWSGEEADGIPGPDTWRLLLHAGGRDIGPKPGRTPGTQVSSYPGAAGFRPGRSGDDILALRRRLVAKGFGRHYESGPDPGWGEADRRAVEAFQRAQGWSGSDADGYPGPETWRRLFS